MEKHYYSYEAIHRTIRKLAGAISAAGYDPDLIVAIGTGGFIPARILKTYLKKPILTVGVAYYDESNRPMDRPRKIQWIDEVERKLRGRKVLLVDEVDDSRVTLGYCVTELLAHGPAEIAVAVLHCKRKAKEGRIPAEARLYFAGEEIEDRWIYYPWDAVDIDEHTRIAGR